MLDGLPRYVTQQEHKEGKQGSPVDATGLDPLDISEALILSAEVHADFTPEVREQNY